MTPKLKPEWHLTLPEHGGGRKMPPYQPTLRLYCSEMMHPTIPILLCIWSHGSPPHPRPKKSKYWLFLSYTICEQKSLKPFRFLAINNFLQDGESSQFKFWVWQCRRYHKMEAFWMVNQNLLFNIIDIQ